MSRLSCILSALFVIPALGALCSCSTALATRTPRDIELGGEWQIDLALSDFPQEAVPARPAGVIGSDTDSSQGSGRRGGRNRGMGGGMPAGGGPGARPGTPEHHFAMPPHLSIRQSATGITVDITMPDGKHAINAYTSGETSVVTTSRGPANRTLGWDGDDYVIRTQAGAKGPQSEVRYALDRDGALSVISTITHAGIYDFQYTLEYDRVTP